MAMGYAYDMTLRGAVWCIALLHCGMMYMAEDFSLTVGKSERFILYFSQCYQWIDLDDPKIPGRSPVPIRYAEHRGAGMGHTGV